MSMGVSNKQGIRISFSSLEGKKKISFGVHQYLSPPCTVISQRERELRFLTLSAIRSGVAPPTFRCHL